MQEKVIDVMSHNLESWVPLLCFFHKSTFQEQQPRTQSETVYTLMFSLTACDAERTLKDNDRSSDSFILYVKTELEKYHF